MKKNLNIYCDTNVLIDILKNNRNSSETSYALFHLWYSEGIKPFFSTQSIVDAVYIMCNTYKTPLDILRETISLMIPKIRIASITNLDVLEAVNSEIPDFEDAVQIACAKRNACDVIISSDKKYKKYTGIPVYTPRDFLSSMTGAN